MTEPRFFDPNDPNWVDHEQPRVGPIPDQDDDDLPKLTAEEWAYIEAVVKAEDAD